MKEAIKQYFPIILATIGVFFAIVVYFIGILGTERGIFTDVGSGFEDVSSTEITNNTIVQWEEMDENLPAVKYVGAVRKVGEAVRIQELFQFEYESGEIISGTNQEKFTIYLSDIEDASGNSVCEKLSSSDIEALEEIPVAFVLDKEQDILYFHKSGTFKVFIKVYYAGGDDILYEFMIPVEAG